MSSKVYTIDAIEGNSNLGVPVFSNYGKMQNYQYICLSPTKKERGKDGEEEDGEGGPLTNANMQFNIDRRQLAGPDERAAEVATAARRKKIKEACEGLDRPRTNARRRNRT